MLLHLQIRRGRPPRCPCCTYLPSSSFLFVGGILGDVRRKGRRGRRRRRRRRDLGSRLSPVGPKSLQQERKRRRRRRRLHPPPEKVPSPSPLPSFLAAESTEMKMFQWRGGGEGDEEKEEGPTTSLVSCCTWVAFFSNSCGFLLPYTCGNLETEWVMCANA